MFPQSVLLKPIFKEVFLFVPKDRVFKDISMLDGLFEEAYVEVV